MACQGEHKRDREQRALPPHRRPGPKGREQDDDFSGKHEHQPPEAREAEPVSDEALGTDLGDGPRSRPHAADREAQRLTDQGPD